MYVNNAQIQKVLELHLHKVYSLPSSQSVSSTRGLDELILSSKATEMQDIKQAVSALPETRSDLVRDLRSKIDSGLYDPANQDIAESMFKSAIENWGKA